MIASSGRRVIVARLVKLRHCCGQGMSFIRSYRSIAHTASSEHELICQRRYFANTSPRFTSNEHQGGAKTKEENDKLVFESWKETCQHVINAIPVGSMTPKDWKRLHKFVFEKWAFRRQGGLDLAWKLLDRLVEEERHWYILSPKESFTPLTTEWLNKAVDAWRHAGGDVDMNPNQVLAKLQGYAPHLQPDARTYSILMDAVSKNVRDKTKAPLFCTSILDRMRRESWSGGNINVRPNEVTYTKVLEAWAKSGLKEAPDRATELLQQIKRDGLLATNRCYIAAIRCCNDGERAEALLQEMLESPHVKVDAFSFAAVAHVWAKCGGPNAGRRASAILDTMEELPDVEPNAYVYSAVVSALGKSGQPQEAEALLRRMQRKYEVSGDASVRPTRVIYNAVIDAYSRNRDAQRAEKVLERMMDVDKVRPDTISFNTVIAAWSRSGASEAAQRVESILKLMQEAEEEGNSHVKLNTRTFNSVISAWARSQDRNAAEKATAVLNRMIKLHQAGNKDVKPNTISFNAVIDAWSKSPDPNAARKAQAILDSLHKAYESGNSDVKPDVVSFTTVILAWSRSQDPQAGPKAESILKRMHELHDKGDKGVMPDTACYNAAIAAWLKSPDQKNAAERAESLLRRMQAPSLADTVSFNSVLSAWAHSKSPERLSRAQAIMQEMQALHESGSSTVKPDLDTFTAMIHCLSMSNDPSAAELVDQYLQKMKEMNLVPDKRLYSHAIRTWSKSNAKKASERLSSLRKERNQGRRLMR